MKLLRPIVIIELIALISFISVSYGSFLTRSGNNLYDSAENEVRLTGVNWFGFETSLKLPHGLWARDYISMLQQIHDLGFNCVRLPWSNEIITSEEIVNVNTWGPDPYNGANPMNMELVGKTPLEALDVIIDAAQDLGLKVILDNHSRAADGYLNEQLWYTDSFTEEQWIDDWLFLAGRYVNNNTVVGFDLNNEPHGIASWGSGDELTDWKAAAELCANAIQEVNSNALIIVEGIENYNGDYYWWGGNLAGVSGSPIEISYMDKLVYSSHEYGPEVHFQPWFGEPEFPENMPPIWESHFGYIMDNNEGHILIGEFGIRDESSHGGIEGVWFTSFLEYMAEDYSWTFWCFNPNSGDTGGILQDDWCSVNQWKIDYLEPHMADMISSNPTGLEPNNFDNMNISFLCRNYPNPFNPTTTIELGLTESSFVSLTIYDVTGKRIKNLINKETEAGYYSIVWDGKDERGKSVESGVYIYKLTSANNFSEIKRMTLLK